MCHDNDSFYFVIGICEFQGLSPIALRSAKLYRVLAVLSAIGLSISIWLAKEKRVSILSKKWEKL